MEKGGTYSSYFDFNNKKLYLLFETLSTQGICQMGWISVCICIIWLCQQGRSIFLLWIICIFHIFTSTNNENSSCFPPDISNSITIARVFPSWVPFYKNLYPPIWPLSEDFLLARSTNYFHLWLLSTNCLRQVDQKSSDLWDRGCPVSFRSAPKSLTHTNTGFPPHPKLLPLWPWAGGLSQPQHGGTGWSSCHQQQWWALPNLLQARSARLV